MTRTWFTSFVLAAAVTIACNGADRNDIGTSDSTSPAGTTTDNAPSNDDRDFVQAIGVAGMAEVEFGRMAAERAASAEVKQFGQMMVDDHTKAGERFRSIAAQHNIPLPTELDAAHQDLRDELSKLQGTQFDREYMNAMVDGHENVGDELEARIDLSGPAAAVPGTSDRPATPGTPAPGTSATPGQPGGGATAGGAVTHQPAAGAATRTATPRHDDNAATMSLNQWAADTYPVVQQHLEKARSLRNMLERRGTTN